MSNFAFPDFSAAQKAGFEAIFNTWTKIFAGIEQITQLNVQLAGSTYTENHEVVGKAFSTVNPLHFFAAQSSHAQPTAEKIRAYNGRVLEIASSTQSELAAAAGAQFQRYHRETQGFLENLTKSASLASQTAEAASK